MVKQQENVRVIPENWHMGRSFGSRRDVEDACPCPQEACGLVNVDKASPECNQHGVSECKTMRQGHLSNRCPRKRP